MYIVILLVSIATFILMLTLSFKFDPDKAKGRINDSLTKSLKKKDKYNKLLVYLKKNNADSVIKKITPLKYIYTKIIMALLFALLLFIMTFKFSLVFNITALAIGLIFGYFFVDIMIAANNSSSNKAMKPDIRRLCSILKMYSLAGFHITETLPEIYKSVKNDRLKRALLELNGEILSKGSLTESVENFRSKFNSSRINILCIVLKQAERTGQSADYLKNIQTFLDDLQDNELTSKEEALNTKFILMMLLVFGGILGIIVYTLFSSNFLDLLLS